MCGCLYHLIYTKWNESNKILDIINKLNPGLWPKRNHIWSDFGLYRGWYAKNSMRSFGPKLLSLKVSTSPTVTLLALMRPSVMHLCSSLKKRIHVAPKESIKIPLWRRCLWTVWICSSLSTVRCRNRKQILHNRFVQNWTSTARFLKKKSASYHKTVELSVFLKRSDLQRRVLSWVFSS